MPDFRPRQFLLAAAAFSLTAGSVRAQPDIPTSDVSVLQHTLTDGGAHQDQREQAAQRLLSRPGAPAREAIRAALADFNQPNTQLAAARALANDPTADASLADPLLKLLRTNSSTEPLLDAAARALTAFKADPYVLTELITLSGDPDERIRLASIRALGTFVNKRAAEALVRLTDPLTQPPRVASQASTSLVYLTGLPASTDAAGWRSWWAANSGKSDAQFQADLTATRSARYDKLRSRVAELEDEVGRTLGDLYQRTPTDQQPEVLARFLRSPEPTVRAAGAHIAYVEAGNGVIAPSAIKEQLRQLVGDARPDVRRNAAQALAVINDADAVPPLLTQLAQETDSSVRAAIADALRPTRNPAAVPALLKLLDDPSPDTVQVVAESLGELSTRLRETNPDLADQAAGKIMQVLAVRTTPRDRIELRRALVQAVTPLQSRGPIADALRKMLDSPAEDPRVRRVLLAAVGSYHDPNMAESIVPWMRNDDAQVRLAAVRALGESATNFGDVQKPLSDRIDPNIEKQADVRDAAWKVLAVLFSKASTEQLVFWDGKLANDPAKLLYVLQEERTRAQAAGTDTSGWNQRIGDAYMQIGRFADAVIAYQDALKYVQANNRTSDVLTESLAKAMLRSGQYPQLVQFAQSQMTQDPSTEGLIGPEIKREAERLVDVQNYDAANRLIDLSLKMTPALSKKFTDSLEGLQAQVKARFNQHPQSPYPQPDPVQNASLDLPTAAVALLRP